MRKIFSVLIFSFFVCTVYAQSFKVNIGPELLHSFNHDENFIGIGGSVQAEKWVKERLAIGLNTGYLHFTGTKSLIGSNAKPKYGLIPLLAVVKYPLPIIKNLYGQDLMGYTFAQDVNFVQTGKKVSGGFTYYFAIGYVIKDHLDIAVKVGRSRLDKKDNPVNVNEHNVGLKIAYVF